MRNEYLPTYQFTNLSIYLCVRVSVQRYTDREHARERERERDRGSEKERESREVILVAEVFQKMVSGAQKRFPTVVGR